MEEEPNFLGFVRLFLKKAVAVNFYSSNFPVSEDLSSELRSKMAATFRDPESHMLEKNL